MKKVLVLTALILVTTISTTFDGLGEAMADVPGVVSLYGDDVEVPPAETGPNSDGDGVADASDLCSGTSAGVPANMHGCSAGQSDPTGAPAALPRATSDRPDDVLGAQMHYVYLVPSDPGRDQFRDTSGQLAQSIAAMQSWLAGQTARGWRMDTSGGYGGWDITFVGSALTDGQFHQCSPNPVLSCVKSELSTRGMNSPSKRYLVYYEGTPPPSSVPGKIACGQATDDASVPDYGAIFLHALGGCHTDIFSDSSTQPRWVEDIVLHETMHTVGIVGSGAPNTCGDSPRHVCDDVPNDLMYKEADDFPQNLDLNQQDYWQHGSFAYTDLARSDFLDEDGVPDQFDNCPRVVNPNQENYDGDAQGDACDTDDDNDAIGDIFDNCRLAWNPGQENVVHPGTPAGDACEDPDADGRADATDNCPDTSNPIQTNTDGDAQGDACDADDDNDTWSDVAEGTIGTDALDNCADTVTPNNEVDPHPADFDDNTIFDITDVGTVAGSFGQAVPPASVRTDIAPATPDGFVDITDRAAVAGRFGGNCLSTGPAADGPDGGSPDVGGTPDVRGTPAVTAIISGDTNIFNVGLGGMNPNPATDEGNFYAFDNTAPNNQFDPADSTTAAMRLGPIDECSVVSWSEAGVDSFFYVDVVVQNVTDMTGYQVRINYDLGLAAYLGASSADLDQNSTGFIPFHDQSTEFSSQFVSFVNLPVEDQANGHRSNNSSQASGTGTVLIGDTYVGTRSAALSADTPSANAPEGGILVRTKWRLTGASDGQLLNFDISALTAPGTKVLVFDPANPDGNMEQIVPETQLKDFRIASNGPSATDPACGPLPPLPPPLSSGAPIGMAALAAPLPVADVSRGYVATMARRRRRKARRPVLEA